MFAWLALAGMLVATAVFLVYETRDTMFWIDEWTWVLERRGSDLGTYLEPHNGHLSLVPVALYKLLFTIVGTDGYTPFRLPVIAAHLLLAVLTFVYARPRVGSILALLATALILALAPGWQNIMWGFQVGSLISLAAAVGALLALDRGDRRGDWAACALVALALASSALGIAVALGVGAGLLWDRHRRRDIWVVAAPLALFALWWLAYQNTDFVRHAVVLTPEFVAGAAAGALSSLVGLSGMDVPADGAALEWGRPLAVAALLLVVWRLAAIRPVSPRVVALLTILLSFWLLTGLNRSIISSPDASRYIYVGGLFIVLLVVELARGESVSGPAVLVLAVAVGAAVVSNIGIYRDAGRYLREQAELSQAALGAVEISRSSVPADHVALGVPGYPFLVMRAGPYLDAADALGSPAATPAEIAAAPEPVRLTADAELFRIQGLAFAPSESEGPFGERPAIDSVNGGTVNVTGACLTLRPDAFTQLGLTPTLALTVPPAGVVVSTGDEPATIRLRRFAQTFPADPQGRLNPLSSSSLRLSPDAAATPWHLSLSSQGRLRACGLR
jgi:hypothetical protein